MLRFVVAVLLLGPPAGGQEGGRLVPTRIAAPVVDRGVYHVATGTWTVSASSAAVASDVLYNNTAPSGYYFQTWTPWDNVDSGRLPSTSSRPIVGTGDAYRIDGYRFAYCSPNTSSIDVGISFYDGYAPCLDVDLPGVDPVSTFLATGLPGATSSGEACWIVAFDLSNTTLEFVLLGDGDGQWDDDLNADSFGWSAHWPDNWNAEWGPIIAGNCLGGGSSSSPPQGFGTAFAGTPGSTDATGLGQTDFFWVDAAPTGFPPNANGGCFFFGGCNNQPGPAANPWGGFWFQVFGTVEDGCPLTCGEPYCSSRVNESGGQALLSAQGSDVNSDLVLTSAPVPNTTGQFFYGPMMLAGTLSLGDGLRCVGGMSTRLLPLTGAGMMMQLPNTASFAVDYSAPYASGLTGTQFFQHWFRSGTGAGTGSNTSNGIAITFQQGSAPAPTSHVRLSRLPEDGSQRPPCPASTADRAATRLQPMLATLAGCTTLRVASALRPAARCLEGDLSTSLTFKASSALPSAHGRACRAREMTGERNRS